MFEQGLGIRTQRGQVNLERPTQHRSQEQAGEKTGRADHRPEGTGGPEADQEEEAPDGHRVLIVHGPTVETPPGVAEDIVMGLSPCP